MRCQVIGLHIGIRDRWKPGGPPGLPPGAGLSQAGAERIVAARKNQPFDSVENLARRAELDRRDLKCLAAAGAFEVLSGHRRHAYWQVAGIETRVYILRDAPVAETPAVFTASNRGREPRCRLREHRSHSRAASACAAAGAPVAHAL